jgi:hypothetical protein
MPTHSARSPALFIGLFRRMSALPARRAVGACCGSVALALVACGHMREGSSARAIPQKGQAELVPSLEGAPHDPQPLAAPGVPDHPFMARHGASCMHVDAYTSNTYTWSGPLGHEPQVGSRRCCPTIKVTTGQSNIVGEET